MSSSVLGILPSKYSAMSVEHQCDRFGIFEFCPGLQVQMHATAMLLPCYWWRHGYCRIGAVINQDFGYCFLSPSVQQSPIRQVIFATISSIARPNCYRNRQSNGTCLEETHCLRPYLTPINLCLTLAAILSATICRQRFGFSPHRIHGPQERANLPTIFDKR